MRLQWGMVGMYKEISPSQEVGVSASSLGTLSLAGGGTQWGFSVEACTVVAPRLAGSVPR